jgi:hypothetical protein
MTSWSWYNVLDGRKRRKDTLREENKMKMVKNEYGITINFEAAVNLMDDAIREALHNSGEYDEGDEQQFFDDYCKAHYDKFGEEFELAKKHPCY